MNSRFENDNLYAFIASAEQQDAAELFLLVNDYMEAIVQGDQEAIRDAYYELLQSIKNEEARTGIHVLESPDTSYFVAVTAFSVEVLRNLMENIQANEPKPAANTFPGVDEADRWLSANSDIEVVSMRVPTKAAHKFSGNYLTAESVTLKYLKHNGPTGYKYGMVVLVKNKWYRKADPQKIVDEWASKHPGIEIVCFDHASIVEVQAGSRITDSGLDRSERITIFVLFRKRVQVMKR